MRWNYLRIQRKRDDLRDQVYATFGRGDLVRLRSGGPTMTVEMVFWERSGELDLGVHCAWMGPDGRPWQAVFDPRALIVVQKNDDPLGQVKPTFRS